VLDQPVAIRLRATLRVALLLLPSLGSGAAVASEPVDAGYRDFALGPLANTTPTREKPESKLWFHDGIWWGVLWNTPADRFEIYRFHTESQDWTATGTAVDERRPSKSDVLWTGQHLYIASHQFSTLAAPANSANSGRLYRYTYDDATETYALDPGFPVQVNESISETLVLDRDSSGRLWVCWTEAGLVRVNCSMGADSLWGEPFILPSQPVRGSNDDISSLIAFGGDKIGIFWSNEDEHRNRFAIHLDSDPPEVWQESENVSPDTSSAYMSDDHINLKTHAGYIYAVTKTQVQVGPEPQVLLSRRDPGGTWTYYTVGTKTDDHTRPIALLDPEQRLIHVLATKIFTGRSVIVRKTASLDALSFTPGAGQSFIDSQADSFVNNITSTKQSLTSMSGLLAIATDPITRYYFHNFLATPPTAAVPLPGPRVRDAVLKSARPSPFRESTELGFALDHAGHVELAIYDLAGRRVRTLFSGDLPGGSFSERWDGRDQTGIAAPAGVYFARIELDGTGDWRRLVRIR
jgi:FlgD Ig-like domain